MNKQRIFAGVLLALGLLLALIAGITMAQGPEPPAAVPGPQSAISVAGSVSSTIGYQGMLTENGSPVNGSRNMVFRLYSDDTCSTQVGSDIDMGSVQLNDGLFDVALPVDQDDFNGQGLWLEAEVDGTTIGCEAILPAPYALSLRPGAVISDTSTSIYVGFNQKRGTFPMAVDYGILAETWDGLDHAVYGSAHGAYSRGITGSSDNATGYGVYGSNTAGGYAGYFNGDVAQGRTDNGLVKAAAKVYCGNSSSVVNYYFNNVGSSITVSNGVSGGRCTIDFNFDLTGRYWSVTSAGTSTTPTGVSCSAPAGANNDEMQCVRWRDDGSGADGQIMVVVY